MRRTRCVSMKIPVEAYGMLRREAKAAGLSPGELARHVFFAGLLGIRRTPRTVTYSTPGPLTLNVRGVPRKPAERAGNGASKQAFPGVGDEITG